MSPQDLEFRKKDWQLFNIRDVESYVSIPTNTCLLAYRGSHAHGMFVPTTDPKGIDDVDLMGVVLGDSANYLGLKEWGSRGTKEVKSGPWDVVFYEIQKFISLLLQGNPNVLSLLWNSPKHILYRDAAGQQLIDHRSLFVGKHVYNAFAGYAHAQLLKMESRDPADLRLYIAVTNELKYRGAHPNHKGKEFERPETQTPSPEERDVRGWSLNSLHQSLRSYQKKGENLGYLGEKRKSLILEHGYDSKNAAHCVRLLRMCKEFLATGEMVVERPDAQELLEIKRGQWELVRVKQLADQLFREIKEAKDKSPLPPEPDRIGAEKLLVRVLWEHIGKEFRTHA